MVLICICKSNISNLFFGSFHRGKKNPKNKKQQPPDTVEQKFSFYDLGIKWVKFVKWNWKTIDGGKKAHMERRLKAAEEIVPFAFSTWMWIERWPKIVQEVNANNRMIKVGSSAYK